MHKKCRIIYMKILEHIKRIHIHKWEYILKENIGVFLGEKYIYYILNLEYAPSVKKHRKNSRMKLPYGEIYPKKKKRYF